VLPGSWPRGVAADGSPTPRGLPLVANLRPRADRLSKRAGECLDRAGVAALSPGRFRLPGDPPTTHGAPMSTIARPTDVVSPPATKTASTARAGKLAPGALGLPSVLFCIVTGAAPLAAMMFNVPVAVLGGGFGAPAAFLLATIVLTIFSVGYIEMSQRVTAAGGFYTFITRGMGRVSGLGAGILIALCYIVFSAAVLGVLGYFTATSFNTWFGIDLPAYVYTFAALAVISGFAFFHIELTAKILGVALIAEVIALIVLSIGVIGHGGAHGLSLKPLNPAEVFGNSSAAKTFGSAAVGIALFGAFWSWVGFEMAPNYAEESREPKKIAKRATYGSVVGLGVFYTFIAWIFVMGWGLNGAAPAVNAQFKGQFASAFYPLAQRYVGTVLETGLEILIITSSFACAMAFYNTSSRYLYSLARERVLPQALARTHPTRHAPVVASMVVSVIVGVYILGFTIYDPSTSASLLKLGTWTPLLGVLGILAVQAIASFAIIRYFELHAQDGRHWWRTRLAPVVGGLAQIGACYLLIANRAELAGAGDVFFVKAIPWIVLVTFLGGMGLALWLRSSAKDRFAAIGSFEADDPLVHEHFAAGGALHPAGA
jgi:amino acid transporter